MKKRIVALLLGGMLAAGSLAMQTPATVWAITSEDCGWGSEQHIKNAAITAGDGQLTVTVDLEFESGHYFEARIYLLEKELDKKAAAGEYDAELTYAVVEEYRAEGSRDNMYTSLSGSGAYTFTGLTGGKTYYAYTIVFDMHDMNPNEDSGEHYACYLGSGIPTSGSDAPADNPDDSNNTPDDSGDSGAGDTPDDGGNNGSDTPADNPGDNGSENKPASITKEECGYRSEPHIKSCAITSGDGQFTVTVDLIYEAQSSSGIEIYRLDKELNKETLNDIDPESGLNNVWKEFRDELVADGYEHWQIDDESRRKFILLGGDCTFTGIENGKTCYIYGEVADWHDYEAEEALHSTVYLGSVTVGAGTSAPDDGGSGNGSSNDSSTNNSSSDNSSSNDSTPANISRNYTKEAEEKMLGQIKEAPSASVIAIDKEITALPNSVMKELLRRGDVSVKLDFTYMGQKYVIVIPAGEALDNDIPWYGPLYLAQQFGNSAETTGFEVYAKGIGAELLNQIKAAPAEAVIVMEKGVMSLPASVMKELQRKGDVSLRLDFTYDNKEYVITIPAGTAIEDDIPWYGPLYLIQHFGSSAEAAN